jgi:hypothetical protein
VATGSVSASTLAIYPVAGGPPATWLHLRARSTMNYLIDPAGWWPQEGIGFWPLPEAEAGNAATVAVTLRGLPGVPGTAAMGGPYDVIARAQAREIDDLSRFEIYCIQAPYGMRRPTSCSVVRL